MEIKATIDGIDRLLEALSPEHVATAVERALTRVVEEIEARSVRRAPRDTGNLIQQITSHVKGTTGVVGVTRGAPYAIYVHEGTGSYGPKGQPYEIQPRQKKALHWPGAPHPVKKVKHPGIRPRPFLKEALEETGVREAFVREIIKELHKKD